MMLPKLKRKARRIWIKSAKRLGFGVMKKIAVIVLIVGFNFYWLSLIGQTNSYFSDTETGQVVISAGIWGTPTPSPTPAPSGVVLNEFLPNPIGNENSEVKPDGEWVELYNLSASNSVNLAGYYLRDETSGNGNGHRIDVENCRTNTGGTIIGPHGFLVVYTNAGGSCNDHGFNLNNTGGDTVSFYNSTDQLVDSHAYTINAPENKSFARIPDGTGAWVDPIPTPGGPNVLEDQELIVNLDSENQNVSPSFSETLGETVASPSTETIADVPNLAPVASESVESMVEPSPSPEATPEVTPESANDGSSVQAPTEPAIPSEPVTPSAGLGQAVEPPADPPAPAPDPVPAPAEVPVPTPAE